MKKFDLYVSRNFSNDSFFDSFEVDNEEDFYDRLRSAWNSAGLSRDSDEISVISKVEFEGSTYDFKLGHYVVDDEDEEIEALFNTPNDDEIESSIAKSLIGDYAGMNEDDMFESLVEALLGT